MGYDYMTKILTVPMISHQPYISTFESGSATVPTS